ncbi:MAG TPA: photosystem II protein Psb27 [Trichocoleus sp.]
MKTLLARLFAVLLVAVIGLTSCSAGTSGKLTGDYREDTLMVISSLRNAIELPTDDPAKAVAQANAKDLINDFASRYRRDPAVGNLSSFTTMRTALNAIAGHYSSYPNRPLPDKLKTRLEQEFRQVEGALKRGA